MKTNSALATRELLLEAASQVIVAGGAAALTLDAVARTAGVSKGGLLYHFPSKEALVVGMIDQLCARFDQALEAELAQEQPGAPGHWLRAYLRASFAPNRESLEAGAALIAAIGNNPALIAPLRERYVRWQAHAVADGVDPAIATAIRLATDGLWLADLGDFAPPSSEERQSVVAALIALTKGTSV